MADFCSQCQEECFEDARVVDGELWCGQCRVLCERCEKAPATGEGQFPEFCEGCRDSMGEIADERWAGWT